MRCACYISHFNMAVYMWWNTRHIAKIRMNTHEHEKQKKSGKKYPPDTHTNTVTKCVDLKIKTMKQTMTNRSNNMQTKKAISSRVEFICVARINKQQQTPGNVCVGGTYCQNQIRRKRRRRDRHKENRKIWRNWDAKTRNEMKKASNIYKTHWNVHLMVYVTQACMQTEKTPILVQFPHTQQPLFAIIINVNFSCFHNFCFCHGFKDLCAEYFWARVRVQLKRKGTGIKMEMIENSFGIRTF